MTPGLIGWYLLLMVMLVYLLGCWIFLGLSWLFGETNTLVLAVVSWSIALAIVAFIDLKFMRPPKAGAGD